MPLAFTQYSVPLLHTLLFSKRWQKRESNVYRLEVLNLSAGDIMRQRPDRRALWRLNEGLPFGESHRIHTSQPTHRDRFDIALDTRNLSCKKCRRTLAHLHRGIEHARRTNVGIPMNLTILQELRLFQSWYQPQHSRLFAVA